MTHFALAALALLVTLGFASPAHAWHDHGWGWGGGPRVAVGVGVGGCCGYYPYYSPYYAYPTYVEPPTVVYEEQAPVTYVMPEEAPGEQVAPVSSPSTIFTDKKGRTCRHFQSMVEDEPVVGTACRRADGSWHTVNE